MEGEKIHQLALYYQMALERLKFAAASMSVTFDDLHQQQLLVPPLSRSSCDQTTDELRTKMLKSSASVMSTASASDSCITRRSPCLSHLSSAADEEKLGIGSTPMNHSSCQSTSFSIDRILGDVESTAMTRVFERRLPQRERLDGSSVVNDSRFESTLSGDFVQPSSKLLKCEAIGFNGRNVSSGSRLETSRHHHGQIENNNEFYKYGITN